MKALKIRYIFAGLLLIGLLTSCQKDEEGFTPDPNPDQIFYTSDIFGVVSSNDVPVDNATVTFKDQVTFTDADGIYIFSDVEIGSQHNVVKISKDGYFDGARTFRSAGSSTQYQQTVLQEMNFDREFNSAEATTISKDRVSLSFPSQAIMVESSGELYTGVVQIAMEMIDPSLFNLSDIMPGDLTAIETDNSLITLESFGMVNVELQSPNGIKLQIASGKSVELNYEVNDEFINEAPDVIDMWSFNYELGLWEKEGQGTLQGNSYQGSVNHFSTWNYDIPGISVVVNGKIVSEQSDLDYFRVSISNSNNNGGSGFTDSEGVFSGRVQAGIELTLKIYANSDCWNSGALPIYEEKIGPFTTDTDLGTIMVSLEDIELLILKGTAVDCNLNPLESGRVIFASNWSAFTFPIIDGIIEATIPVCSATSVNIRIVDAVALKQTIEMNIPVPGETDLNQVVVCDEITDYIKIDNLMQGAFNVLDTLAFSSYTTALDDENAQMSGGHFDISHTIEFRLQFHIANAFAMEDLELKTYDVILFDVNFNDDTGANENYEMLAGQTGQITIESIEDIINTDGMKKVTGTYTVDCSDELGGARTLTGSFNLNYRG